MIAPRSGSTEPRGSWTLLDTPCLLVDLDKLEANIESMAKRATEARVALRPHFKTHKSIAIARKQVAAGAAGFAVSKLDEAEMLLRAGLDNILVTTEVVAYPKSQRAVELARGGKLILAVDSLAGAQALGEASTAASLTLDVSIEVDSGLSRCGVLPREATGLARAIAQIDGLRITGLFTHGGHIYAARDKNELETISSDEIAAVEAAAAAIGVAETDGWSIGVGSTPAALIRTSFGSATEIRPGNYVFLDAIQVSLGVASVDQCALTVGATVMSRPTETRVVIDAGSKTLGLDTGAHGNASISDFGQLLGTAGRLVRLSEEHGVVEIHRSSSLAVGDRVRVLPNHACSVTNLHDRFYGLRADSVHEEISIDAAQGVH